MLALPSTQAPTFGLNAQTASSPSSLLSLEQAESLLQELVDVRWERLSSECDDPLGLLYAQRIREWTAGWHQHKLYLLVWEAPSWDEKPTWRLYANGRLIYQEQEGRAKSRKALCEKLLESKQLPSVSAIKFLEPLIHPQFSSAQRHAATQALMSTVLARPEIFDSIKAPLFQALETDLANPDWPVLEVLKLHRLAHKNELVWLFRQCVQTGLIRALPDNARLDRALSLLQDDYVAYGYQVNPIFRPAYDQAYNAFRQLITAGTWRVQLRLKIPG